MSDKEKVIQAALEEIKVHSLRFTMEDLTRRLRMSKTSLYKIVASKDQVISEVVDELIRAFNQKETAILTEGQPILDKLKAYTQSFMTLARGFDDNVYAELQRFYEKDWERWQAFRQEKINVFMRLMQEGIDAGVLRPINRAVVYQCLSASMNALASPDFLDENNLTYSQAIDVLQEIVFHGLLNGNTI